MNTANAIVERLISLSDEEKIAQAKYFGVKGGIVLGISAPEIRSISKEIKINHPLALELWQKEYHEARMIATLIADKNEITSKQMDAWTEDFDNWAIVDGTCYNLYRYTPFAEEKIFQYCKSEKEYIRRTSFSLIAGLAIGVKKMPDEEFLKTLTKEEIEFKHRVDDEWASEGVVITTGMLKWRRYKIWDKGDKFFQEYPEDDVSFVLQTKGSVFSHIIVDKKRKIPLDEFETWAEMQGMTKTEQEMFKNHQMYGGVDGAEGTESGDNHSFAVIDVDPQTNQGVVIFEITNNYPIDVFDLAVSKICNKFNINLGVEKNGIGLAHVRQLTQLDVIFEEWTTSGGEGGTRPVMLSELEEAYRKDKLIETYSEAEDELRNIEYTEKKSNSSNYRAEAKKGKHDDRVFSRAIAYGMINKPRGGVTWI